MALLAIARQLFAPPGAAPGCTRHLLAQAAACHARLLALVLQRAKHDELRAPLEAYLRGSAPADEKRRLLDEPSLLEALHMLAAASPEVAAWDATVAPGCALAPSEQLATIGWRRLENVVAALRLRRCRDWRGRWVLATDDYGRLRIPFSDWVGVLVSRHAGGHALLPRQAVELRLDAREAQWRLEGQGGEPLVHMPRAVFDAMFCQNDNDVPAGEVRFGAGPAWMRFERVAPIPGTPIRFEPIGSEPPASHAETTGALVTTLLSVIARHAPEVHAQLCQCIRAIQGFELPAYGGGQIASFSVPTSPGIIGINVPYTARDEPRLSPYAFLWLGHELGHTLSYLIDDVAFAHGWRFLENPGEFTPIVPRYGRRLTVRTLFSVPYVHLFEWWLLWRFQQEDFAGLPWDLDADPVDVGEDLRREIAESFDLIAKHARLTVLGSAVLARLRELTCQMEQQWCAACRPRGPMHVRRGA